MELLIDKYFCLIVDRLEFSLFGSTAESDQDQTNPHRPLLISHQNFVFSEFVSQLQIQAFFGLLCNFYLFAVLLLYVPNNILWCWSCSPSMTVWLIITGTISTIVIIPKVILIRKLLHIEDEGDTSQAKYYLWRFFQSKVFIFNKRVNNVILISYLAGLILFNIVGLNRDGCETVFGLVAFLFICFLVPIIISLWKIVSNLIDSGRLDTIFETINDTFAEGVQSLKEMIYCEYAKKSKRNEQNTCSICYEAYEECNMLRIMKCPGSHAFHKECIDKWLAKSERCPQCNLNVLGK